MADTRGLSKAVHNPQPTVMKCKVIAALLAVSSLIVVACDQESETTLAQSLTDDSAISTVSRSDEDNDAAKLLREYTMVTAVEHLMMSSGTYLRRIKIDNPKKKDVVKHLSTRTSTFVDDGTGNDYRAGDGVYSETILRTRRDSHDGISVGSVKSFLTNYIVSQEYVPNTDLERSGDRVISRSTPVPGVGPTDQFRGILRITCDWAYGGNGCRAAEAGWCSDCCVVVDLTSCSVTAGW